MNKGPLQIVGTAVLAVIIASGGYAYWLHKHNVNAATAQVCSSGGTPQVEKFQPYVLATKPAPIPAHVTEYHRHLKLVPRDGHEYLADPSGRYYDIGRDSRGHIYPTYYDRVTDQYYPLYYDHLRDRYYRVCQDNGQYYQSYVDDPESQFYPCDDSVDYSNYPPPAYDCPIISDPYATFTCYDEPSYYYDPGVYAGYWHDDDWLWGVPIVIGAYFVLDHGSYPGHCWYYCYNGGRDIERTVCYQTIYNAPVSYWRNGRQYSSFECVAPPRFAQAPRADWGTYDRYGSRYAQRRIDPYGHFAQHPQLAMAVGTRGNETVALGGHSLSGMRVASFNGEFHGPTAMQHLSTRPGGPSAGHMGTNFVASGFNSHNGASFGAGRQHGTPTSLGASNHGAAMVANHPNSHAGLRTASRPTSKAAGHRFTGGSAGGRQMRTAAVGTRATQHNQASHGRPAAVASSAHGGSHAYRGHTNVASRPRTTFGGGTRLSHQAGSAQRHVFAHVRPSYRTSPGAQQGYHSYNGAPRYHQSAPQPSFHSYNSAPRYHQSAPQPSFHSFSSAPRYHQSAPQPSFHSYNSGPTFRQSAPQPSFRQGAPRTRSFSSAPSFHPARQGGGGGLWRAGGNRGGGKPDDRKR